MANTIGFSTGCLYRLDIPLIDKIKAISKAGCNAIEFMFFTRERFEEWDSLQENDKQFIRDSFDYVSLHAPVEGTIFRVGDVETKKVLGLLSTISEEVGAQSTIFHADTIKDIEAIKDQPLNISVENLTDRQGVTRNLEEMRNYLESLTSASVTFDVAHAFTKDPSGGLAENLVQGFGSRVAEAHISGVEPDKHHTLYHTSDNDSHFPILKMLECPLIHEGVLENPQQLTTELNYIRERL